MRILLLGILAALGVAVFFSFTPSTPSTPSVSAMEKQFGVESIGGWILSCDPREDECTAILNIERGSKHTKVQGRFGSMSIGVQIDRRARVQSASVKYDDGEVSTFQGVELMAVAVDGRGQRFDCRRGGCRMTAPDDFVSAMRGAKIVRFEPRGRDPVEIDVSVFAKAWDALERKGAEFQKASRD